MLNALTWGLVEIMKNLDTSIVSKEVAEQVNYVKSLKREDLELVGEQHYQEWKARKGGLM